MCLRKAWEECGRRVHGLDLCVGDARNASEIAIQGWHVKRERECVGGAVGERGTTEPALLSEGG
jgi:hypothetical protein